MRLKAAADYALWYDDKGVLLDELVKLCVKHRGGNVGLAVGCCSAVLGSAMGRLVQSWQSCIKELTSLVLRN